MFDLQAPIFDWNIVLTLLYSFKIVGHHFGQMVSFSYIDVGFNCDRPCSFAVDIVL